MRRRSVVSILCGVALLAVGLLVPAQGAEAATTKINFEAHSEPCDFNNTVALHRYGHVTFAGPAAHDGGGILDRCGSFGVTGFSGSNFLAFNKFSAYSDSGIPQGPETITFPSRVHLVKINAGSDVGGTITMNAFSGAGGTGTFKGTKTITMGTALAPLVVRKGSDVVKSVVITSASNDYVLDDLVFQT